MQTKQVLVAFFINWVPGLQSVYFFTTCFQLVFFHRPELQTIDLFPTNRNKKKINAVFKNKSSFFLSFTFPFFPSLLFHPFSFLISLIFLFFSFYLLVLFGGSTPGYAQGLHLSLYSNTYPSETQDLLGLEPRLDTCKVNILATVLLLQPR